MDPALEFFVRVGGGAPGKAPAFSGIGFRVVPDHVLTCRYLVQEQTPHGRSTAAVRNALMAQAGDGWWVVEGAAVAEVPASAPLNLRAETYSHVTGVAPL